MMKLALCGIIFLTVTAYVTAQDDQDEYYVDENVKDMPLFNITYTLVDTDCTVVSLGIKDNAMSSRFDVSPMVLLPAGQYSSLVTLVQSFDYEKTKYADVEAVVNLMCSGIEEQRDVATTRIYVDDVIDSQPSFTNSVYSVCIPENQPMRTVIVSSIVAEDLDTSDRVNYTLLMSEEQQKLFESNLTTQNIDGVPTNVLEIVLVSSLDFETTTKHRFTVLAEDTGNMTDTAEVIINVVDVQDTPPTFSLPFYTARIGETTAKGDIVVNVSATDGDLSTASNEITYAIIEGPNDLFEINNKTGAVIVAGNLDIDVNPQLQTGQVLMVVQARELDPNTNMSRTSGVDNVTSTVQVQVAVLDVNDNEPEFNAISYAGYIRENALVNELILVEGGGFISVTDRDRMPNNNGFALSVEKDGKPWAVFESSVSTGFAHATVLLALKQPEALKGLASTHLKFQIVASDMSTQPANKTSADFLLWIVPQALEPEAVVDIPLRTSDFIIFIMGVLILLNIVLTFMLCCLFRRRNNSAPGLFNRNHKYYVSERDRPPRPMSTTSQGGIGKEDGRNLDEIIHSRDVAIVTTSKSVDGPRLAVVDESTTMAVNSVASILNRSRCDVAPMDRQNENTVPKKPLVDDRTKRDHERDKVADKPTHIHNGIHREAALVTRKETGRCDVTPLKTRQTTTKSSVPAGNIEGGDPKEQHKFRTTECDVIPHETGKALSNLWHKVHQKLSSTSKHESDTCDLRPITEDSNSLESSFTDISNSINSSFSDKAKCDVTPLIVATGINKNDKNKLDSHVNPAFSDDSPGREASQHAPNGKNTSTEVYPIPRSADNRNSSSSIISPPSTFLPPLSASQTQITQTGVPHIALALPFSTAVVPKEQRDTVTNPVFNEGNVSGNNNIKSYNPTQRSSIWNDGQHNTIQPSIIQNKERKSDDTKVGAMPPNENLAKQERNKTNPSSQQLTRPSVGLPSPSKSKINDDDKHNVDDNHNAKESDTVKHGSANTPTTMLQSPQMTISEPNLHVMAKMKSQNQDFVTAAKKLLQTANSSSRMTRFLSHSEIPEAPKTIVKPPRNISFKDNEKTSVSDEKLTEF